MELLETQHPERKKLIETSDRHKRELEKEVKDMSDKTEKVVKNALIIGGALAITYLLVSQLGSGKKKKKARAKIQLQAATPSANNDEEEEETPSAFSAMGVKIADTATVMLLDLAKEALADYLKTRKQKDANS
jgi:branched-subunit amino acid permease